MNCYQLYLGPRYLSLTRRSVIFTATYSIYITFIVQALKPSLPLRNSFNRRTFEIVPLYPKMTLDIATRFVRVMAVSYRVS